MKKVVLAIMLIIPLFTLPLFLSSCSVANDDPDYGAVSKQIDEYEYKKEHGKLYDDKDEEKRAKRYFPFVPLIY